MSWRERNCILGITGERNEEGWGKRKITILENIHYCLKGLTKLELTCNSKETNYQMTGIPPGILRDKTIENKLVYISNNDEQN